MDLRLSEIVAPLGSTMNSRVEDSRMPVVFTVSSHGNGSSNCTVTRGVDAGTGKYPVSSGHPMGATLLEESPSGRTSQMGFEEHLSGRFFEIRFFSNFLVRWTAERRYSKVPEIKSDQVGLSAN